MKKSVTLQIKLKRLLQKFDDKQLDIGKAPDLQTKVRTICSNVEKIKAATKLTQNKSGIMKIRRYLNAD